MTRKRILGLLALLLVVVVGATSALGQGFTTGSLTGKVESENAPLPGVTVAIKSPSLQGVKQTVTSGNGSFTFQALPPGKYTATFTIQGFSTLTKDVTVTAGQPAALDVNMTLSGVQATAIVTAKSDIVSSSTQASTTITSELTNRLPNTRTIAQAAQLSSGVNGVASLNSANPPITVSGAPTFDNLYTVDGAVITDNIRATPNNLYIEDAIQETSTSVNSISAEYGRFQGGVINTVTKSGGNAFSGSFRTTFTNDAWSAVSPANEPRVQDLLERYEATLGGPIWKDHIWFFGAFRSANTSQTQTTYADTKVGGVTPPGGIPGSSFVFGDSEKRYQGKLTLTPIANHTLAASYMKITDENTNYIYPNAASVLDTAGLITRQLPQDTLSISYNGVLTTNFFLEGMYSNRHFTFENSGSPYTDIIKGTILRDRSRSNFRYNAPTFCGVCGPEKRDNEDILIKGTYFLSAGSLGSHNIVLGYDDFKGKRTANNYQSGSNYRIWGTSSTYYNGDIYPIFGPNSFFYYTPISTLTQGTNTHTKSAFLNDQWRLNDRLSFNLGVRYDKNDAQNSVGASTANDSAFSPRIAANFDVTGKGNLRIGASYAHYVGGLQDSVQDSTSAGGQPATYYWYYGGTPINVGVTPGTQPPTSRPQAIQQAFDWFFAQGCPNLATCTLKFAFAPVIPGLNAVIPNTIKSPYAREYTVGLSGNIGASFSYRADFVRRDFHDFYDTTINMSTGTVNDPVVAGKKYDLGFVGNTNDVKRNYTGLQTQFQYRWQWLTIGGNWTWSHTLGNFDGENATSGPIQNATNQYPEYKQMSWNAPTGSMATDQTHRVRILASADLPFIPKAIGTFNLGLVQAYDTGAPYGAVGAVRSRLYVADPGYQSRPSSVTYYYTARDAFRTDDIKRTDLSLTWTLRLFNTLELFVQPQVINAFNNQGAIVVDTTVRTAVSPGTGNTFQNFDPYSTTPVKRVGTETTANWDYGPNFGKPTSVGNYQQPRTFILTGGLRF
jgi:outer membrane receptor for ferrienterochelin and colicin